MFGPRLNTIKCSEKLGKCEILKIIFTQPLMVNRGPIVCQSSVNRFVLGLMVIPQGEEYQEQAQNQ